MTIRIGSIIGWTCAILVAAFNLFAAVMKFVPVTPGSPAEEMGRRLGVVGLERQLGILEIIILHVMSMIGNTLLHRNNDVGIWEG